MNREVKDTHERGKQMSKELGINYYEQDWGIVNGDANRLEDFVEYFEKNQECFDDMQKYMLFELIISSFNEAILESVFNDSRKQLLEEFLKKYSAKELYKVLLDYWRGIKNEDEMPVGFYI